VGAEQQTALVVAYDAADVRIRQMVTAAVLQAFNGLGSWRDADIARFVDTVLPIVAGAQRQMGSLTEAYLSAAIADMLGEAVRPAGGTPLTGAALRGGTKPAEVYARPIRTVWQALADGKDLQEALAAARLRLWQITTTDLQLAKTHAARQVLAGDHRVVGYRRVLKGSQSCGLCLVASTQRYHRAQLLPIHPGCDCGVAPIVGDHDPGQVLNSGLLEQAHAAIADRFGVSDASARNPDYRDFLVTHEHGEIGPVLARKGDAFTGPSDLH
jgi:hypothetical protein